MPKFGWTPSCGRRISLSKRFSGELQQPSVRTQDDQKVDESRAAEDTVTDQVAKRIIYSESFKKLCTEAVKNMEILSSLVCPKCEREGHL